MGYTQLAAQKQRAFALRMKLGIAARIILPSLLPLGFLIAILGGMMWKFNFRGQDVENAPLQTGTAVVTTITQVNLRRGFSVNYTFCLDGHVASFSLLNNTNTDADKRLIWTKVGDMVPVAYRVGKSGTIYIENWQAPPHKVSLSR